MKIDKTDLIGIGLSLGVGVLTIAKALMDKKTDEEKIEKAVEKVLDQRSKSK